MTGRTYTRDDIERILEKKVRANAKQWGEDSIYTKWAREAKEKKLAQYDVGEVIEVESESYYDDGFDYGIKYYSDGTVSRVFYGYAD